MSKVRQEPKTDLLTLIENRIHMQLWSLLRSFIVQSGLFHISGYLMGFSVTLEMYELYYDVSDVAPKIHSVTITGTLLSI